VCRVLPEDNDVSRLSSWFLFSTQNASSCPMLSVENLDYDSFFATLFMRLTVIASELVLVAGTLYASSSTSLASPSGASGATRNEGNVCVTFANWHRG